MAVAIAIIVLLVGLAVSIGLHELGHLWPAKKFGVRVPQYFVGFGPTLWSKRSRDTEYGIKAIPLGGYVRLVGMFPPADEVGAVRKKGRIAELIWDAREDSAAEIAPGEEHRAFYRLSVPKKITVMLGGPFMNLVLALALLIVVFTGIGIQGISTTLGSVSTCIAEVNDPDSCQNAGTLPPAAAAGLQAGDKIVAINGTEITEWSQVQQIIAAAGTSPLEITYLRGDQTTTVTVTPTLVDRPMFDQSGQLVTDANGQIQVTQGPVVGITPRAELQSQPISAAFSMLWEGTVATFGIIIKLPVVLYDLAKSLVTGGERDPMGVMGPLGIGQIATEIVAAPGLDVMQKVSSILAVLASLNIALFAFNMIPLLPLDGGHIAGALWEGAKKQIARWRGRVPKPADTARLVPLTYVMFFALIGMAVLLLVADIVKPISLTG